MTVSGRGVRSAPPRPAPPAPVVKPRAPDARHARQARKPRFQEEKPARRGSEDCLSPPLARMRAGRALDESISSGGVWPVAAFPRQRVRHLGCPSAELAWPAARRSRSVSRTSSLTWRLDWTAVSGHGISISAFLPQPARCPLLPRHHPPQGPCRRGRGTASSSRSSSPPSSPGRREAAPGPPAGRPAPWLEPSAPSPGLHGPLRRGKPCCGFLLLRSLVAGSADGADGCVGAASLHKSPAKSELA
jgi:hypothetical protein